LGYVSMPMIGTIVGLSALPLMVLAPYVVFRIRLKRGWGLKRSYAIAGVASWLIFVVLNAAGMWLFDYPSPPSLEAKYQVWFYGGVTLSLLVILRRGYGFEKRLLEARGQDPEAPLDQTEPQPQARWYHYIGGLGFLLLMTALFIWRGQR
jgi:hypothetical protein